MSDQPSKKHLVSLDIDDPDDVDDEDLQDLVDELNANVNAERKAKGLPPLAKS